MDMQTIQRAVARAIDPLRRRVALTVGRGVVTAVNDATKAQELQLTLHKGEVLGRVERFGQYGFTSHPHPGAEAACVFVAGNRDHGLVLAVEDRRYRVKSLAAGEVAIYTDEGDSIQLLRGNRVRITTGAFEVSADTVELMASSSITLDAPSIDVGL